MTAIGAGLYERIWRVECGFAAIADDAITEPDVWETDGEPPILAYPLPWSRDPAQRELVFAAAPILLYKLRFGAEALARGLANQPALARAVALDPQPFVAD